MNLPCNTCTHASQRDGKYHCEARGFTISVDIILGAFCDFYVRDTTKTL